MIENEDIELEQLLREVLTERGLRRIINEGYRIAYYRSISRRYFRGSTHDDRIRVPSSLNLAAYFIDEFHPAAPKSPRIYTQNQGGPRGERFQGDRAIELPFHHKVGKEFKRFICTNDRRYNKIKQKIAEQGKKSQVVIISVISAAIASHLGTAAGAIVPLIAIFSVTVLKIGKEAYCASLGPLPDSGFEVTGSTAERGRPSGSARRRSR